MNDAVARLALSSKEPPGLVQPPLISRWSVLVVETSIIMSGQTDLIDNEMAGMLALKDTLEFLTEGNIVGLYSVYHVFDVLIPFLAFIRFHFLKNTVAFIENKEKIIAILAGLRLRVSRARCDKPSSLHVAAVVFFL